MGRPRLVLLEAPESKITYERDGVEAVCAAVRSHYPKHSQLMVASYLRDYLDIDFVDMKIREVGREKLIKQYSYGEGTIRLYAKGASFDQIIDRIEAADAIGITSNFTKSSGVVVNLIGQIKKSFPDKCIIVGGVDATFRHRYYLEHGADLVALGDIDGSFADVIGSFFKGIKPAGAGGISYQWGRRAHLSPASKSSRYRLPIDDVPLPSYDLLGEYLNLYREPPEGPLPEDVSAPFAFLFTSKGCNNTCTFCTVPQLYGKYRYMSGGRVERELKYLKNLGISTVVLMEDNLLSRLDMPGGEDALKEIFYLLRSHGFAWEFGNGIEIGKLIESNGAIRNDLLDLLFYRGHDGDRCVGAYRVYVPLESLEEFPQLVYEKLRSYDEEKVLIEAIAATGIPMMTFGIILGKPDDEEDHFERGQGRCLEIRSMLESYGTDVYFTPFIDTLLPGTLDYQVHMPFLEYPMDVYPELYHFHAAALRMKNGSAEDLLLKKMKFEDIVNGAVSTGKWRQTGKYAFQRHHWGPLGE